MAREPDWLLAPQVQDNVEPESCSEVQYGFVCAGLLQIDWLWAARSDGTQSQSRRPPRNEYNMQNQHRERH